MENLDFELVLYREIAEIMAEEMPEHVRALRLSAVMETQKRLRHYAEHRYLPKLLCAIAEKKCQKVRNISTKMEMNKLISPRCPAYNGRGFEEDDLIIPEEELILWSEMSLLAPLNGVGFLRYMELFKKILPDECKENHI